MTQFEILCDEYRENKRMIEELTAINDELKANIIEIMGDRETVVQGAVKATNKTVHSSRFDSTGFRKSHPDLYDAFTTMTHYKRFTVV